MYSFLNFMSGDSINKEGGATNRDWLMNQMSNAVTFMTVLGNTIGKNNVVNGENSTVVRMNEDRTKGIVVDAKADGDKKIYDENGKVVGQSGFDDSFFKYGLKDEDTGPAYGNTIHFDKDVTDEINELVKKAVGEFPWTVAIKSMSGGDYDIKNVYAKERRKELGNTDDETITNYDYHYDGYMYNGEYFSARSLGNILFGRNIENIPFIPNAIPKFFADLYQGYSNNTKVYKETPEAIKSINYGIEEQSDKNFKKAIEEIRDSSYSKYIASKGTSYVEQKFKNFQKFAEEISSSPYGKYIAIAQESIRKNDQIFKSLMKFGATIIRISENAKNSINNN